MKGILIIFFLVIGYGAAAQKIDVHNGMIFNGNKPYSLIDRDGCGFSGKCRVTLSATDGRTAIIITYDPASFGGHTYATMHFIKSNTKARVEDLPSKESKLAKYIVKENLFSNGELNDAVAEGFVKQHLM